MPHELARAVPTDVRDNEPLDSRLAAVRPGSLRGSQGRSNTVDGMGSSFGGRRAPLWSRSWCLGQGPTSHARACRATW